MSDDGIFVVQFPNGDSLEYLAYTHLNIRYRFSKIRTSSNYSKLKTVRIMLCGGILNGMDPPGHLWAVSKKGIEEWAKRNRLPCETFCRHLGDLPFSPGFYKKSDFRGKLRDFIGQKILSPIRGGTHLVAVLRKSGETAS